MSNTLLLVDGNAVMHRSYHALPPFKTRNGIPTHIIYGFFSILFKSITDFNPTHLIICFDTPAPTFRNTLYEQYQIQRPKINDDFISQIPLLKQGLDKAHLIRIEKDGFEADDLIGTISTSCASSNMQVLILSGDKDILQLVNERIHVVSPQIGFAKTILYDPETVKNRLGITPSQIADYKALAGDSSDNYKGAKGIGPKTAAKLINQFTTVENIYKNLDMIENVKTKKILIDYQKDVELGKKLAVIVKDVPIEVPKEQSKYVGFHTDLQPFLTEYELYSIMSRIFKTKKTKQPKNEEPKPQLSLF